MHFNLLQKKNIRTNLSRGQTLVEYALILAFISVVAIGVLLSMGGQVTTTYSTVTSSLGTAQLAGATAAPRH